MTPKTAVSSEVIAQAVHLACRAPSIHNSQPWRFVGDVDGGINLFVDRDRLVDTDSSGRQALISCGAVLDHFRVAMAAVGWTANVEYYPNPNDSTHLAYIEFSPIPFVIGAHRRRANAILTRRTDRLPFKAPNGWYAFEPILQQAVGNSQALLDVLPDDTRPELADASHLTEALRLYDTSYHVELAWWTGIYGTTDGIPPSSLVSAAESDRVDINRSFPVTQHRERRCQVAEDESKVLALSALDDTRRDILRCGEALSITLLEATMAGFATCPITHMTEVAASRAVLSELTGRALPQVLIRIGVVPMNEEVPPPTPRRPLDEVLSWQLASS